MHGGGLPHVNTLRPALRFLWQGRDLDRAYRYGEFCTYLREALEQVEIDRLLDVHVQVVARVLDDIHALEFQRLLAEAAQVGTVEAYLLLCLDRFLDDGGCLFTASVDVSYDRPNSNTIRRSCRRL